MVRAGLGASSSSFRTYVFLPFQGRNQGGWLQALFVFHFFWIVGRGMIEQISQPSLFRIPKNTGMLLRLMVKEVAIYYYIGPHSTYRWIQPVPWLLLPQA
ncbi:uncharacterized protein [Macrobrachium rosenbergii]|uniref:uncharacterized protein isoform X2 n=1 Tax=Macrobrachium rosenbergii TaxID=79674 RepID=UPI0034D7A29B